MNVTEIGIFFFFVKRMSKGEHQNMIYADSMLIVLILNCSAVPFSSKCYATMTVIDLKKVRRPEMAARFALSDANTYLHCIQTHFRIQQHVKQSLYS